MSLKLFEILVNIFQKLLFTPLKLSKKIFVNIFFNVVARKIFLCYCSVIAMSIIFFLNLLKFFHFVSFVYTHATLISEHSWLINIFFLNIVARKIFLCYCLIIKMSIIFFFKFIEILFPLWGFVYTRTTLISQHSWLINIFFFNIVERKTIVLLLKKS